MTVRVYKSSDPGAPQLSGNASTLIDVLNGCLVTGYGSKAAAGWTRPYNDTNVAVFKQGEPSAKHSHYLRVYDPGSTSARVVGYETMTDANTGTNLFPSEAQLSGGLYWYKPTTTTTTRPWMVFANERTVYVWWATTGGTTVTGESYNYPVTNNSSYQPQMYMFGDFKSYSPGEKYSCAIIGSSTNAAGTGHFASVDFAAGSVNSAQTKSQFMSRPSIHTSTTLNRANASCEFTKCYSAFGNGVLYPVAGTDTAGYHPFNAQNKWYFSRVQIVESVYTSTGNFVQVIRGELPGIYASPVQLTGVEDTHTITSPNFPGKTLMCKPCRVGTNTYYGFVYVETSDTWEQ